jgi:hypothetical protein
MWLIKYTKSLGKTLVKLSERNDLLLYNNYTLFQRGGFFVECGALDGERSSNTIWLEDNLGWTGLLIEVDPFFYTQALGKNRRVYSINACLSPYKYISAVSQI